MSSSWNGRDRWSFTAEIASSHLLLWGFLLYVRQRIVLHPSCLPRARADRALGRESCDLLFCGDFGGMRLDWEARLVWCLDRLVAIGQVGSGMSRGERSSAPRGAFSQLLSVKGIGAKIMPYRTYLWLTAQHQGHNGKGKPCPTARSILTFAGPVSSTFHCGPSGPYLAACPHEP